MFKVAESWLQGETPIATFVHATVSCRTPCRVGVQSRSASPMVEGYIDVGKEEQGALSPRIALAWLPTRSQAVGLGRSDHRAMLPIPWKHDTVMSDASLVTPRIRP